MNFRKINLSALHCIGRIGKTELVEKAIKNTVGIVKVLR